MARCYDALCDLLAWNPPPDEPPPDDEADAEAMFRAFGSAGWTAGEVEERENQKRRRAS